MNGMWWIRIAGGGLIAFGFFAFLFPDLLVQWMDWPAETPIQKSEVRSIYGGLFAAMGLVAVLGGERQRGVQMVRGFGYLWLGVVLARGASILFDGYDSHMIGIGLAVEAALAFCFLYGPWKVLHDARRAPAPSPEDATAG